MRVRRNRHAESGGPVGLTVGAFMSAPPVVVPAEVSSADALRLLGHHVHETYPVVGHDGKAIGLLRTADLRRACNDCYATLVGELTDTDRDLLVEPWLDVAVLAQSTSFRRAQHAVVVNRERIPVGIVARSDLVSAHEQLERRVRVRKGIHVHS